MKHTFNAVRETDSTIVVRYSDGELVSHPARIYDSAICPEHGSPEEFAAFIVRACNAHDELVAALEAILIWDDGSLPGELPGDLIHAAQRAYDKAKGE